MKSTLKKKAWSLFSQYIRMKNADKNGIVKCVTCGESEYWKYLQAGHFVDGRNNTVLFDERLVHPQCYRCNVARKGNKVKYFMFMKSLGYTDEELNEFDNLKFKTKKITQTDYEKIIGHYKERIELFENKF